MVQGIILAAGKAKLFFTTLGVHEQDVVIAERFATLNHVKTVVSRTRALMPVLSSLVREHGPGRLFRNA